MLLGVLMMCSGIGSSLVGVFGENLLLPEYTSPGVPTDETAFIKDRRVFDKVTICSTVGPFFLFLFFYVFLKRRRIMHYI